MNITLRQFQAFLAVADLGSFTQAAKRLRVAQPALSMLVRDLEVNLGVRLLDRTTRRTELTEAGQEFRSSLSKIMGDLDHAVQVAGDFGEARRGRLAIAAPPLLAAALLPRAIAEFRTSHSGIDVAMMDVRTDVIVNKVRSGEADCGVGTFAPGEDGVSLSPLGHDELLLFCSPTNPLAAAAALSWADIAAHPLIALTRDSGIRLLVDKGFESCGRAARPVFEAEQITTAVALVEANLGVAVLPTYAWTAARFRNLFARPLVPSVARELSMIRAAGRTMSPPMEAFARILRKHIRLSLPNPAGSRMGRRNSVLRHG